MKAEVKAVVKTVRIAPRKSRLVIDLVRGKSVDEALAIVKFTPKAASPVIEKLIKSAVANAVHKNETHEDFNVDVNNLYIKEAYVDEGPTLKRFLARAKGRATAINKRTSHITVVLAEKE